MKAEQIAIKAAELVSGDRERVHGPKERNFENIAMLWNSWLALSGRRLDKELSNADVAKMMALLKIARMESGEHNEDDAVDGAGYLAIAGELAAAPKETGR